MCVRGSTTGTSRRARRTSFHDHTATLAPQFVWHDGRQRTAKPCGDYLTARKNSLPRALLLPTDVWPLTIPYCTIQSAFRFATSVAGVARRSQTNTLGHLLAYGRTLRVDSPLPAAGSRFTCCTVMATYRLHMYAHSQKKQTYTVELG